MGDRPIPVPFQNSCPLGPWADGLEPESVTMTVFGGLEGAAWTTGTPLFPNDSKLLPFQSCGVYAAFFSPFLWSVTVAGGVVTAAVRFGGFPYPFGGSCALDDPAEMDNVNVNPNQTWYGGSAVINLHLDGVGYAPSWDAADLVVVPMVQGMFAEELETDIASRKLRYARHSDGTNIKVYLQ